MNVQVLADPFGRPLWASPALPGAVHDIRAARAHGIIDALSREWVKLLVDGRLTRSTRPTRSFTMLSYPSGMTTSSRALNLLADLLRGRRTERGTRWHKLPAGRRARRPRARHHRRVHRPQDPPGRRHRPPGRRTDRGRPTAARAAPAPPSPTRYGRAWPAQRRAHPRIGESYEGMTEAGKGLSVT
jgi:hypothetical protein